MGSCLWLSELPAAIIALVGSAVLSLEKLGQDGWEMVQEMIMAKKA